MLLSFASVSASNKACRNVGWRRHVICVGIAAIVVACWSGFGVLSMCPAREIVGFPFEMVVGCGQRRVCCDGEHNRGSD